MSIDLWTVDPADWENLAGVLALQLQLAYSLSRVGVFTKYTYIRVMAPVLDPTGSSGSISKVEVEAQLKQLLKELRVSAEVVALASFSPGAPPPAVYPMGAVNAGKGKGDAAGAGSNVVRMNSGHAGGRKKAHMHQLSSFGTLSDMNKIEAFNCLVRFHSTRTCVVFVPLPGIMIHQVDGGLKYAEKSGPAFIKEVDCISAGLPPCMLVVPGEHAPIVSTAI